MGKKYLKLLSAIALVFAVFGSLVTSAAMPTDASIGCISGFGNTTSRVSYVPTGTPQTTDYSSLKLYPGGVPFGVKFMTEGIIVTGVCNIKTKSGSVCPANTAGLRQGDILLKANDRQLTGAEMLTSITESSGGKPISIEYLRGGKANKTSLTPVCSADDGKYKSGLYVRDSGAGIGTVTYIVPETLSFGGLGHGICEADTGRLTPMGRGTVVGVTINGVVKGVSGAPGEVRGYFSSGKTGTLLRNTDCGVFGAFATLPQNLMLEPMPVGTRNELKAGKAYILSTLDGTQPQKYKIQISDIHLTATGNKCFTVKVTDKTLIEKSGGIVQGMSGSPIIQNGKLVGAVTHVLINDPTTGYGIFIENMLNAAKMPMQRAA
jgi:stage IV sporulation protein B